MPNHYPFHRLDDAYVILQKHGVYTQAAVYRRGDVLYAKHGSGYVRLAAHGTSVPHLMVDGWDLPLNYSVHPSKGWLVTNASTTEGRNAIQELAFDDHFGISAMEEHQP